MLPEAMKHWSLTSLQTRLIKTGGRLVRHARRLVFQLAEVLVSRGMLAGMLEGIGRLRLAPGESTLGVTAWMTMLWGRPGQKGFPRERLGRRPAVLGFYAWQYSGCPMKAGNLSESGRI